MQRPTPADTRHDPCGGASGWRTLWLLVLLASTPAHAEWQRVEAPAFVLFVNTSPRDARALAGQLDRLRRVIAWRFAGIGRAPGAEAAGPGVRPVVVLAENMHALHMLLGDRSPAVGGLHLETPDGLMVLAADTGSTGRERHDALFSAYALHVAHEQIGRPLPAWFAGGLADYFAETALEPGAMSLGEPDERFLDDLAALPWNPYRDVIDPRRSTAGDDEVQRRIARAQAWLLTHWLLQHPDGAHALDAYLEGASDGRPAEALLQGAFGTTSVGLEGRMANYAFPIDPKATPVPDPEQGIDPTVSRASSLADADVAIALQALIGTAGPKGLARLRGLRTDHPDDRLLLAALGRAERDVGTPDAALALAGRLLELGENVEGETLRGTTYLALAARPEATGGTAYPNADGTPGEDARPALRKLARNAFATVLAAQPRHLPAMWGYWRAATEDGEVVNVQADALLARAFNLAPQHGEIAWALATLLLRRGQDAAARHLLNELVNTRGMRAAQALELLARADTAAAHAAGDASTGSNASPSVAP